MIFLLLWIAGGNAAPAAASGRFESQGFRIEVKDAYSYWGETSSPIGGTVIRVAVSESELAGRSLDEYHDRDRALKALAGDNVALAFFEFDGEGRYHGLSYYVEPGNGCGYCLDPEVESSVRAAGGRLAGHLKFQEKDRSFDVDLDVPIPATETGKPLAAGGGDAGKAYLAYQAALHSRARKELVPLLDAAGKADWEKWEERKKLDDYLDYLWKVRHLELTAPDVTGGFLRGDDRAVLQVTGKNSYTALEGEVLMRREDGAWRVHSELFHLK